MFQNEEVSGVLDFDWTRVDVRIFDIAFAMVYFCAGWQGQDDGKLSLEKVSLFLQRLPELF